MKTSVRVYICSITLFLIAAQLSGSEGLEFRQGSIWIGNAYRQPWTEETVEGSEASTLTALTGVGYTVPLQGRWQVAPGIDLWYKDFAFTEGRAVPTQIETAPSASDGREVAGTLGIMLAVPVEYSLPVSEQWFVRGGFSPTTLYRIPLLAVENSPTDNLSRFFYESGRFLYPELRLSFGYRMEERITFQFAGRWLFPVFRLWDDGPDLPWWDSHMIAGQLGILIRPRE